MPLLFLSDKDRDLIQGILDKSGNTRVNTPSRPQQERSYTEGQDHQAPETYIALAPTGGIPAIDGATPGSAECDIYKILEGDLVEAGFTKLIYNLSPRDIPRQILVDACPETTLISSICFDEDACEFTVCDRDFCFPLGTRIEEKDCGDAGTGAGPCDVGTGTDAPDFNVFNYFLTHRDKFGTWLTGNTPVLDCEVPGTGTGGFC